MPAGSYGAESPSLFGNTGGPLQPRYNVDVPGAIEALAQGTGSLIHGIYNRRMARNQQAIEQQRYAQQAQWHQDEIARQREHDAIEQQRWERDQHLKELTSGVTPGSTSTAVVPSAPATLPALTPQAAGAPAITAAIGTPPAHPSDISAHAPGEAPLPAVEQAANTTTPAPGVNRLPQSQLETTTTPESYDPTKAVAYQRQVEAANIYAGSRRDVAQTTADSRREVALTNLEGRKAMANAARYAADKRLQAKGSETKKAMTGNALESRFERVDAPGILEQNGWDLGKATDALEHTPEGQELRANGFSARHLAAAYEKHVAAMTAQATRAQNGAAMLTPEEAAGNVTRTRELVRSGASSGGPAPTSGGAASSSGAAPAKAPAKALVAPAKAATSAAGEPTDDELREALASGIKPDDEAGALAYIAKQRAKKAKK